MPFYCRAKGRAAPWSRSKFVTEAVVDGERTPENAEAAVVGCSEGKVCGSSGRRNGESEFGPRPVDDPEELERPVEVADIMLAYGQTQSAIDVLKGFVDAHPAKSFKTAMRLLELYKQSGMQMEFEELRRSSPGSMVFRR